MQKIILATRNLGKTREIQSILDGLPLEILSLSDFPNIPEIIEDGATLEENALKKARQVFEVTSIPALSDDTGLEVFHLDLRPGVISARYAGDNVTYAENNQKLLAELKGVPMSERTARFRCISVFNDGKNEKMAEGICHGHIIEQPRGTGGFGYDPIFIPKGYNQTFAELSEEIKNQISHRAKAFQRMRTLLREHFQLIEHLPIRN